MKFFFWLSAGFILYTYVGYPLILFFWSKLFPIEVKKKYLSPEPLVSVVIAAFNEESHIEARIENLTQSDYDKNKLEIIIVSDGSTDNTNEIVKRIIPDSTYTVTINGKHYPHIRLIQLDENRGKSYALNIGVNHAKGEFIVFTDVRQFFEPNAIKELISNFCDSSIGCVSGELVFRGDESSTIKDDIEMYWTFEKGIRRLEGIIGSVIGATGGIYAIRTSLFPKLPEGLLLDDVYIPMDIVMQGYRVVFDNTAIAYDVVSRDIQQEKRRKIRTLSGNYQILQLMPHLLSLRYNPIFFQYVSHKLLRLFVPFLFLLLLLAGLSAGGTLYKTITLGILAVLAFSLADRYTERYEWLHKLNRICRLFLLLNYFALIAFCRFVLPFKKNIW